MAFGGLVASPVATLGIPRLLDGAKIHRVSMNRMRGNPCQLQVRCSTEVEQMKELSAAQKRWEAQVRDGKIKALSPKEAGYAVQLSKYTLLDVRPSSERSKAWVKGSVWIPVYDSDKNMDPGALLKKLSTFAMGGWWSGLALMKYNERFMPDLVATVPKSANVIVACQKGLRSLAACEQMYKAGYRNIFWLSGGFDAVEEGEFEREGPQALKLAGIGGISEFLGWTDVQRRAAAKEGFGYRAVMFGRLVLVVLAVDSLFIGAQQLMQRVQMHN
ncbi:rhodanese-like domain-containing protein 11, chloroplastic [Selaginella moellendorffii]|uniref:rhodanese-like domain-containing protein 11, chloroplastic n=1 Tax=Selaginella moellendorffii TaxID=88036 RepID=UPI000D1C504B|nr:rhodanese-like domain-containing protein 11, chloroplastic [Selaginella moellendorffii]|eukprot:XP_002962237.2 rhodanese-like domain-containing protein 11, chloroplastic [Selaginella moellendorffii]